MTKPYLFQKSANRIFYGGFTLIEVVVALGIAAMGLLAVSGALSASIDISRQLQTAAIANWVAGNRMSELRMNRVFSTGGTDISYRKMAGREWRVVDNYHGTSDPDIIRVVTEVYKKGDAEAAFVNVGFLARYKPPES